MTAEMTSEKTSEKVSLSDVTPDIDTTETLPTTPPSELPPADMLPCTPHDTNCEADILDASTNFRFVRNKKKQFVPCQEDRFRNNLIFIVGFLELGNGLDFPANVWNDIPVPTHAIVLMAIGGTAAAILSIFAVRDALMAWSNIKFLKRHRRQLKLERQALVDGNQPTEDIDVLLTLTAREMGSELLNRLGMDVFGGFGALLISAGTYMAIGGANPDVFLASNLLSGYVGNAPIAAYGLVNFCWSIFLAYKAQCHIRAASKAISGTKAMALVYRRSRMIQAYCTINGTATLLGGAGSLMTATRWYGYVILVPVVIMSPICNLFWRRLIGYTRDYTRARLHLSTESLLSTLHFVNEVQLQLEEKNLDFLSVEQQDMWPEMLAFIQHYGMMEGFCCRLLADAELSPHFVDETVQDVNISTSTLGSAPVEIHEQLTQLALQHIRDAGRRHFINVQRFNTELLSIYLHLLRLSQDAKTEGRELAPPS